MATRRGVPGVLSHIKDYLVSFAKTIVFLNKNNHFYKKHKKTYTTLKVLIQFIRKLYVSLIKPSISKNNIRKPIEDLSFLIQFIRKLYFPLVAIYIHIYIYFIF